MVRVKHGRGAESEALECLTDEFKARLHAHTPSRTEFAAEILAAQQPAPLTFSLSAEMWADFRQQRRRSWTGDAQPLQQRRKQASKLARSLSSVPTTY